LSNITQQDRDIQLKVSVLLKKRNLTLTQLAKKHKVSQPYLSMTIAGTKRSSSMRQKLAEDLGCRSWEELQNLEVTV
jgi:transcriptional regulator with XRE-family HTH domain